MEDISLKEENTILELLGHIREKHQLLYDSYNSLDIILKKINMSWESTGKDKESYIIELNNLIYKLQLLSESIYSLEKTVYNYLSDLKLKSNNYL